MTESLEIVLARIDERVKILQAEVHALKLSLEQICIGVDSKYVTKDSIKVFKWLSYTILGAIITTIAALTVQVFK